MDGEYVFYPPKRLGLAFHGVAIVLFAAAAVLGIWQVSEADIGPAFLLYMVPVLLSLAIVPFLAYRALALRNASYKIEREGMRLRWGLRIEDIPMNAVMWVYAAHELASPPPLPVLRWPGAVLGIRRAPGTEAPNEVEYLASNTKNLVLIGTPKRAFAISPADPAAFVHRFERFTEMGSLTPMKARSAYPEILIGRVWENRPARALILASLSLSLALLTWVSLAIPTHGQVLMGFSPDGTPGDPVPAVRLLLLPIVNTTFILVDLFLGLFLFRREASRSLAYLVWGGGVLTPVLFLIAVFFMLRSG